MSRLLTLVALLAACQAAPQSAIEVPDDAVVHDRLARLQTPQGVVFVATALQRREALEPMLTDTVTAMGLPEEVLAVALVESGFANIAARPPLLPGGGVWQFIPATGRAYGLQIDEGVDERMDPALSTAAAMGLLTDLHREFDDWGLAFAAYNIGSRAVNEAIRQEGTRDCWELIRRDALPPYAADVMAAVQILEERG